MKTIFQETEFVIIVLSKPLEGKSNNINIQNFIIDGRIYIPIFTSKEKFNESIGDNTFPYSITGIRCDLLFNMLNGNEDILVNPQCIDSYAFNMKDIKKNDD
jgi:hypothetical protein